MDWNDSPEQATFRQEVRAFIEATVPQAGGDPARTMADVEDTVVRWISAR